MRLPRVRFTVRTLLAAVALVALTLGAGKLYQRWSYCRERAAWYRAQQQVRLDDAARSAREVERWRQLRTHPWFPDDESRDRFLASLDRRTAHYQDLAEQLGALSRRFERAASRPWLAAPRDSSEPRRD